MKLTTLVEITRIRQEVREPDLALEKKHIKSPEVFLVILLEEPLYRVHGGSTTHYVDKALNQIISVGMVAGQPLSGNLLINLST